MKKILRSLFVCAIVLTNAINAWGYGEYTGYVLNDATDQSLNTIATGPEYTISGPAKTLTFEAKKEGGLTGGLGPLRVEQKVNGSWKEILAQDVTTSYKSYSVDLNQNATAIRFRTTTGATYTKKYRNVKITRATTFSASTNSLNLGTTGVNKEISGIVTLTFNNTYYPQPITATSNNTAFSVSIDNASAGETGSTKATISFNSAIAGNYSGTVTFNMNGESAVVNVTAKATEALITSIDWDQSFMSLSIYDEPKTINLAASVVNQQGTPIQGANVVYTLGDNADGVVSLNGNQLTIDGVGETTITASYNSPNEDTYTSSSNTKRIVVGDGSACNTLVINESRSKDCNNATFILNAPADKLNLQYKKLSGITLGDMYVDAYDASGKSARLATYKNSSTSWKDADEIQLNRSFRKIVVTASFESASHYVQNVTITQATYLEAVSESLNATGEGVASTSVTFNYSNLPTAVSASLEGVHDEILLEPVHIGDGCGSWEDGATMNLTFRPNGSGKRQYTYDGNLVLSAGSGDNITSIKIPLIVTITMPYGDLTGHYAMFYNESEVSVTADAYYATWAGLNGEAALELIKIESNVPAQTPVLLHDKNSDFYTYEVIAEPVNPTLAPTDNAFVHTDAAFVQDNINYNYYVLAKKDNQVAFYKFTGTIPTGKVVLVWDRNANFGNAPARFDLNINPGITTDLVPVYEEEHNFSGQIYTIMGVPVADMSHPGIYIVHGKKYIVR